MKKFLQKASAAAGAAGWALLAAAGQVGAQFNLGNINPTGGTLGIASDPGALIRNVITIVIAVAALLTFFYLVWGAINWITSGGDKGKVEEARNKITAAVIGLLILAATWAIFQLVLSIAFGTNSDSITIPSLPGGSSSGGSSSSTTCLSKAATNVDSQSACNSFCGSACNSNYLPSSKTCTCSPKTL